MKEKIHSIDFVKCAESNYGYYAVTYSSGKTNYYDFDKLPKTICSFMEKTLVHRMCINKDLNGFTWIIHEYRDIQYDFKYCRLSEGSKYRIEYFTENMQTIVKREYVYAESEEKAKELANIFIKDISGAKYYEIMKCA